MDTTEQKSFLGRNIAYIVALYVLFLWGLITLAIIGACVIAIFHGKVIGDLTVVTTIWGAVSAVAAIPVNYYLGSSQGSVDKQKTIDKMTTPTPTPGVETKIEKTDIIADPTK